VRVVLARLVQPEHGHHRVADELLHDPTVRLDVLVPPHEVRVDHAADVLGVEVLGEHREVDQVGEQHRDELALLTGETADERRPLLVQGLDGGVDHCVADRRALRLEGGDRSIEGREVAVLAPRLLQTVPAHPVRPYPAPSATPTTRYRSRSTSSKSSTK
jgi:hypothetical protein